MHGKKQYMFRKRDHFLWKDPFLFGTQSYRASRVQLSKSMTCSESFPIVLWNLVEYIDREALTYNFGPTVADCPVFIFCSWNIKEKFGIASRHYWALLQAPFIIIYNSCSAYNLAWSNWKTYSLFIIMNVNSEPLYLQEESPLKLMGYKNIPLQSCHWIH